jgi:hypothetical protein
MTKNKFNIYIALIIFFFFFSISISRASTEFFFEKDKVTIKSGDIFTIDLKISTDKTINVVDGTILFDKYKLKIIGINKDDSLLTLWAKEPIYDNNIGELSFVAGVPNGYSGKDGKVISVTFKAKNDGQTLIGFKDIFKVLTNDGLGTSINPWIKPIEISIGKNQVQSSYYIVAIVFLILIPVIILIINRKKLNDK